VWAVLSQDIYGSSVPLLVLSSGEPLSPIGHVSHAAVRAVAGLAGAGVGVSHVPR
jgi:hypothetical protein